MMTVVQCREQFAKAPDAAGAFGFEAGATLEPEGFEFGGGVAVGAQALGCLPAGEEDFKQVMTVGTAEVLVGAVGDVAAVDAAQARDAGWGGGGHGLMPGRANFKSLPQRAR